MRTEFALGLFLVFAAPALAGAAEPAAPDPGAAADPNAATSAAETGVLTQSADKYRRMTLDVRVDDKGPFAFVVDTGAENTLIARELATQLALREGPEHILHSLGATRTVRTTVIPRLAVNSTTERNVVADAIAQDNLGAAGVLGLSSLKSQRMLLDFKSGSMTLTPSNARQETWEGESVTVTAKSRLGELILTDAGIEKDHVWVILDTGNDISVGNGALQRLLSTRGITAGAQNEISLIDVNGITTQLAYVTVDHLRIATLDFRNVPIGFADAQVFTVLGLKREPALLLGMDVLRLFGKVSIDFGNRKVRFQRPETNDAPAAMGEAPPAAEK